MKKRLCTTLTAWVALSIGLFAQTAAPSSISTLDNSSEEKIIKSCGTIAPPVEWEHWMQEKVAEINARVKSGELLPTTYTIPMIFHILHSGEPVGVGRNIAAARVQEQIDLLNKDFTKTNPDFSTVPATFQGTAADFSITFCLAKVDANGNTLTEPGINRINIATKNLNAFPWTTTYMNTAVKPATIWNPEKFLNVWVFTPAPLAGNATLLGYATFPPNSGIVGIPAGSIGTATTDGFAVNYRFLGNNASVASTGRTATHEIGHWLGLRHIWGDDSCGTDYCNDTPPQKTSNYGCKTHPFNVGACSGNTTGEMFMNYMDYSDDKCLTMFTNDQKTRAVAALTNSPLRKALVASTRCDKGADLAPVANFAANKINVTAGGSVNFYDLSLNIPTSWQWSFEGGNPATSGQQNPAGIKYNTVGNYTVKLVVKNAIGKDSLTRTTYVHVVNVTTTCDTLKNYAGTDYVLYFLTDKVLPRDSGYVSGTNYLKNKAVAEKYEASPGKDLSGIDLYFGKVKDGNVGTSLKINIWSADSNGAPSKVLASTSVSLKTLEAKKFKNVRFVPQVKVPATFFVGFEIPDATLGDTIAVSTSRITDGLINLGWSQDAAGQWTPYAAKYNVGLLNNIIYPIFCPSDGSGISNELKQYQVNVYPNPSQGIFYVDVNLAVSDNITIEVFNLLGELVTRKYHANSTGGIFSLDLSKESAGCYFVKVSNTNSSTTQRIIVSK